MTRDLRRILQSTREKGGDAVESPVFQLLDQTLALRIKAFEEFEQACKATGLMAGRKASPTKRKVTKPR